MSKKNIAVLISVIASVIAAVTAVIVFRRRIASFIVTVTTKNAPSDTPRPDFTQEERESFADI